MRFAAILFALAVVWPVPDASARTIVDASAPADISVSIYRDPDRAPDDRMNRNNPGGFAMISETRTVTLPAGESTIRFEGVAEGMVGVSAIVTGLPGGTIEKNRNADLLSPGALVNGALGNRVTITRTNPATGEATSERAIVRTRADGGLVLQSSAGYEAVRCAGLPEKLTFDRVPSGLSAMPIYSVDTNSASGGTYEVTLTYLAWGFDWQADYVATLGDRIEGGEEFSMRLLSWLTLLNDNGQSFDNATLQIIAGRLNIESDFEGLADPPTARPLQLTCYPIGSTAAGSPLSNFGPPVSPPPPPPPMAPPPSPQMIVVTAARRMEEADAAAEVVTAEEENLGDLKLFRVPDRVNVSAMGQKQVAFLNKEEVKARYLYQTTCNTYDDTPPGKGMEPADILLVTRNVEEKGLGMALPQGEMTIYEPTSFGLQVSGATELRDLASGQDVELELGASSQVHAQCGTLESELDEEKRKWWTMFADLSNANPHPVTMRLRLGWSSNWDVRFPREEVEVKNGYKTVELTIPANSRREFRWKIRSSTRN